MIELKTSRILGARGAVALIWCATGLLCTGCGISGRWAGRDLQPEMARDQFDLLRPAGNASNFVGADFRLQQDGTFTADLTYGGELVTTTGTWKYEGDKLTVTDRQGRSQAFLVRLPDSATMHVVCEIKGTAVQLILKKQ